MGVIITNAIIYLMLMTAPITHPVYQAPAYIEAHMIAHAGGAIDGKRYTNSAEALEQTLARKSAAIEVDFMFTTDQVLVCNHGWDSNKGTPLAWDEFQAEGTKGGYHAMSAEILLRRLGNTDVDLIVDTQEPNAIRVYAELIRICSRIGCASYIPHIIPQIYAKHEAAGLKKIAEVPHKIYTIYKNPPTESEQYRMLGLFCRRHGIETVTIPVENVLRENLTVLRMLGLHTAAHTVNEEELVKELEQAGVEIVYSDILY